MAIKIDFIANVRDFLRGTKDASDALDDVADSLDDLVHDADKAGTKAGKDLADGISDGTKDADKALDKLEKSFKDALGDVGRQSKKVGDDLGDDVKHGAHQASEGMDDFKENTKANLKETAASFGSIEDALGGIQGLAAEALEGFGPAGVAAGAAVALGIGAISSKLQDIAEKTNAAAEEAGQFALAWRDATDNAERAQILADNFDKVSTSIADSRRAWELWQDRAVTQAEEFAAAIEQGSLNAKDLADAFTGTDLNQSLEAAQRTSKQLGEELDRLNHSGDLNAEILDAMAQGANEFATGTKYSEDAVKASKNALDEQVTALQNQQIQLEALAAAQGQSVEQYKAAQQAASDAAAVQEDYNASLADLVDPVAEYEDLLKRKTDADKAQATAQAEATKSAKDDWTDFSEDVKVTIDDFITDVNAKILAKNNFERNLGTIAAAGGQALADELRAKGPEVAGAAAATIAAGGSKKIQQLARQTGILTGASTGEGVGAGIKSKQANMDEAVQTTVSHASASAKPGPVTVPVKADTRQFQQDIADAVPKEVTVRVNAYIRANPGLANP